MSTGSVDPAEVFTIDLGTLVVARVTFSHDVLGGTTICPPAVASKLLI